MNTRKNTNEFILITNLKKLCLELNRITINIPNSDFVCKDRLYTSSLGDLELTYKANTIKDRKMRIEVQREVYTKLKMIDFFINRAYLLKYISQGNCTELCALIDELAKICYGWISVTNES